MNSSRKVHVTSTTAGRSLNTETGFPNRIIAARVSFPPIIIPLLERKSSNVHASISSEGILEECTFLNIIRAFATANSSKSAIVALGTISADQSLASKTGSSRITASRSCVISTNESSTRCHAFL